MSKLISNQGYIGMAKQSVKGTPAASSTVFVKYMEETSKAEFNITHLREGGDGELVGCSVKNRHTVKWGFKCLARPQIVAYLYAWFLGEDVRTGAGIPYTHTLTRGDSRSWLTIYKKLAHAKVERFTDCKIESITVDGEAGKELMLAIEGMALDADLLETGSETPSYETHCPFVFHQGQGRYKNDEIVETNISKFTIKTTIASQDGLQTDGVSLNDLPDLKLDIDVSMDIYAENITNFKKANYNNGNAIDDDLYSGEFEFDCRFTDTIGAMKFFMNIGKFVWQPVALNLKGDPETIKTTIAGIGSRPAAGELITVVIDNELSADLVDNGS